MHISIPINGTIQYINVTQISPLISHANVKVCYVGQEPNRNGTVITRELAEDLGKNLPGSPVVGFYDKETGDFKGHERELRFDEAKQKWEFVELTKPYGFVPTDAKVWFEKFSDEGVEHEYLCTECYLWTTAYPESKRVVESGNNQSMELNGDSIKGAWAKDNNVSDTFFIYNEALIEKLCILGSQVEPCFEGSQIKAEFSREIFSLKTELFSLMEQLQETLNKEGGCQETMELEKDVTVEENFAAEEDKKEKKPQEEPEQNPDKKPEEQKEDHACGGGGSAASSTDDKKKKKYDLDDVVEYAELMQKYNELNEKYEALLGEKQNLASEVETLHAFKAEVEKEQKKAMIDSFYMLSDEQKKDCVDNIDTYSLNDIEAKLAIICVKEKVSFEIEDNKKADNGAMGVASLFELDDDNSDAPSWIKAVKATEAANN